MVKKKTAITANQEEKITVKIATQQKQENLASLTSIDKSVYNDTAATLTSSSSSSLKSVNNNSGGSGTSYSHSSNNNSNKSQQYQQRFHNKPQYNNNNNNHNNYGFQQQKHSTTQSPPLLLKNNYYNNNNSNNNGFIIEGNKNFKNIDNIKDNNNGHLNGDNKKYNINNSGINNNTNKNNVGVNNTSTNSENFSYGFSKNFAKIRQHDSDVSPRPRRPYQNDSSSRYYNKSSDGTGQGRIISGDTVNSRNIPTSIGEGGGGGSRRQFINSNIDYNNSLNQSSGYNNRSVTPPDPIKGGGFNNSNNIGGGNNIGGQQGGSYINKNHVRSNIPYQQQQQQQPQQYNNYKNPYNNGRENNYYNKYNENGSGGGGAGGRPQYNRGSGNSGIGELREYSPSASPNLNGGPRLAGSLQRNIASENNRGLSNNINNRGPSYDNNGPRRPINNNNNNNYNSLERGIDRNDRDRDRDRGIDKFDRDRGFDRVGVDRDRIDRDRNERYPSEREKRFEHIDKLERGPLPPSVLRPDSRPLLSENSNNTGRQPYQGRDSGNYSPQSSSASPIGGSPKRDDIKGNGGTSKSEEKSVDRWIPPSLRSQHVLTQQDKNDAVFRKVRGILNKLTPEKFHELCEELLKVDLRSTAILNGVVLLIFEKALDEPKYSSMYAQVCKRLRDEASSYEDNPQHASTFIRILLNVCRDKFYNPATASSSNSNNNNKNSNNNKSSENNSNTTNIKFDSKNLSEKDREYYNKENDDEITTEEEERRHVAKQRILGNVKFIGELSKLQMLSTSTIHRIIQDLFERKKRPDATLQDWCEDMECLCQLIRTCGKDLDSKPSQKLMDQYIAKMDQRSKSTEYPPRIRFMLRDIIELRDNNWVPRKVTATEGPVPIRQIRTDDDSVIRPPYISRNRDLRNNDRDSDHWMNRLPLNLQSSNFNDMFSSLSVTGASPIMSPGGYNNRNQRNNQNNYNNYNNNRYNKHNNQLNNMHGNNSVGSGLTGTNQFSSMLNNKDLAPRFKKSLITTAQESIENIQMRPQTNSLIFKANMNIKPPMLPISTPLTTSGGSSLSSSSNNTGITGLGLNNSSLLTSQQQSITSSFKSDTSNGNNTSAGGVLSITGTSLPRVLSNSSSSGLNESSITSSSSSHGKSSVSATPTPVLSNNTKDDDIMLVTKHGSIEKPKGKKDKGPGKDKIIKGVITFLSENIIGAKIREDVISDIKQNESAENSEKDVSSTNSNENNQQEDQDGEDIKSMNDILALFYEIKVPDKHMKDVTYAILNEILDKNEQDHVNVIAFLQLLRRDNKLQSNSLLDAFKQIVNKMSEKESTIPKITTIVASLLALSVQTKLCKLSDIAVYTEGGQHYPLMLLVLQKLHKTMGRDSLEELFQQSKVDLMASLPEADRNKDRLAEILEDRKLTFLYPLLKVQQEMLKQIQLEDNPQIFYKWIKTNIDAKYHKDSGFITALMTVILKYVTQETMSIEGSDLMKNPDKSIIEKEEDLFQKYCHILEAFLTGDTQLQLIAVYALQVFCYNARFPKGMLCRWFKNLYESNVIEEEAFFRWKEEVTDEYPGKGTALFQVNQWLTWLEQAESEDED